MIGVHLQDRWVVEVVMIIVNTALYSGHYLNRAVSH